MNASTGLAASAAALAALVLASAAHAAVSLPVAVAVADPAVTFAIGSPAEVEARQVAVAHWGVDPCGGQVALSWGVDDPGVNARASWSNAISPYANAGQNGQCAVVFNRGQAFDWPKFCTIVVHEYGHLSGEIHSTDGPDVMSPVYHSPSPDCVAAPNPLPVVVSAPGLAPAARAAAAPVRTSTRSARRAIARGRAGRASARSRA